MCLKKNKNIAKNDPWSPPLDNSNRGLQNNSLFRSSQDNISDSNVYDLSNMKKSLSADVSSCPVSSGAPSSLDAYLSNESSLIHFDQSAARSRTLGNPFQSAKPNPLTINEMRAQNNLQTLTGPTENNVLPVSSSMPVSSALFTNASYWSPENVSPSQNPFM